MAKKEETDNSGTMWILAATAVGAGLLMGRFLEWGVLEAYDYVTGATEEAPDLPMPDQR